MFAQNYDATGTTGGCWYGSAYPSSPTYASTPHMGPAHHPYPCHQPDHYPSHFSSQYDSQYPSHYPASYPPHSADHSASSPISSAAYASGSFVAGTPFESLPLDHQNFILKTAMHCWAEQYAEMQQDNSRLRASLASGREQQESMEDRVQLLEQQLSMERAQALASLADGSA